MSSQYLMGIDLAINNTGIAIVGPQTYLYLLTVRKPLSEWMIHLSQTGVRRFIETKDYILRLCLDYNVDKVIIEDFSYGSVGRAVFDLGQVHGVLRAGLIEFGIDYELLPPTKIKKIITGKGNAKKEEIIKEIQQRYNIDRSLYGNKIDDLCDSLAIVYAYKELQARQ